MVDPDKEDDSVVRVYSRGSWKRFEVDKVFGQSSTQDEVCTMQKSKTHLFFFFHDLDI